MSLNSNLILFSNNLAINAGNVVVPISQGGTNATNAVVALNNMSYLPGSTGAVARSATAKLSDWVSVKDFGAVGNGTTDDTSAVQAAINVGGSIYFPPGTYKLSSQITYTMPTTVTSINIFGAGAEQTQLVWAAGGGMRINHIGQYNSSHVRDLCFMTGSSNVGGGLLLNQNATTISNPANSAVSDVTNCTFRGSDNYANTYYWSYGVGCLGVSNVNFQGVDVVSSSTSLGIGVVLQGTSSCNSVVYNFQSCIFNYTIYGIDYGTYVQGVSVNQCNFTGGQYGIITLSSLSGLDQLIVSNTQFETTIAGIQTATFIPNTIINSNLFLVGLAANGVGINLLQAGLYSIIGNTFNPVGTPTSAVGIQISTTTSSYTGSIVGNVLFGMTGAGINLGAGANHILIESNVYLTNGVNVQNAGTNNLIYDGGYVYTVSILPTANNYPYTRTFVSDAAVAPLGNFGNIVVGGGSNKAPVFSDGTNWRIG